MRSRKHGETISDYVAAIRELALHCKFSTQKLLEEMLRDWLVCGVNHQRKLLSEADLTYDSALKLEASERDSKKLVSKKDVPLALPHVQRATFPATAVEGII